MGPTVRLPDGTVERSAKSASYVRWYTMVSRELAIGRWLRLGAWAPSFRQGPLLSGACLLARREAVESVGGFSSDLFLYGEDVDLCLSLQQAGWATGLVSKAAALHITGTGSGGGEHAEHSQDQISAIKGASLRWAHYELLKKYRGMREAECYRYLMLCVLSLRITIATLTGRRTKRLADTSALRTLFRQRGLTWCLT